MSASDRFTVVVSVLLLWILAIGLVGVALHGFEVISTDHSLSLTVSLMGLGGVLYLLSSRFVGYYNAIEFRLF